jgi:signal transduction histidine kinase
MVLALARAAVEARRVVASANDVLRQRLLEREAELRESYAREQDVQKRALLLEERQRIVRDMHDGIGGQLLGIAMQVRAKQLDGPQVEQALEGSIADLRLIVDSLDSADEGLAEALQAFAHRARAQAKAANCSFDAHVDLPSDGAVHGPRVSLQVLRILQEALTNALRHGAPTQIVLSAAQGDSGVIEIALRDNGQGLPSDQSRGLGLKNMRGRAVAIGAAIEWRAPEGGGTEVRVTLPPLNAAMAQSA